MDETEVRWVIKFLEMHGIAAKQIHDEICSVYNDVCQLYDTAKSWKSHSQKGQSSTHNEKNNGRPSIADDASNIAMAKAKISLTGA